MREVKSSGIAIVLSFFWTGLGQLYAGRVGRGLVIMFLTPVIWVIGWVGGLAALLGALGGATAETGGGLAAGAGAGLVGLVVGLVPFVWWVWGMLDAKRLCERYNMQV